MTLYRVEEMHVLLSSNSTCRHIPYRNLIYKRRKAHKCSLQPFMTLSADKRLPCPSCRNLAAFTEWSTTDERIKVVLSDTSVLVWYPLL